MEVTGWSGLGLAGRPDLQDQALALVAGGMWGKWEKRNACRDIIRAVADCDALICEDAHAVGSLLVWASDDVVASL